MSELAIPALPFLQYPPAFPRKRRKSIVRESNRTTCPPANEATSPWLWYGGDLDGKAAIANVSNADYDTIVYSDFRVPRGEIWSVDTVLAHHVMDFSTSLAFWEIRKDMSEVEGGKLVRGGMATATLTPTGKQYGGMDEYALIVSGLKVFLRPGTYWLAVVPVAATEGKAALVTARRSQGIFRHQPQKPRLFCDSPREDCRFFSLSQTGYDYFVSMGVRGKVTPTMDR